MAKKPPVSCLQSIGDTAGKVWQVLSKKGPMTAAKLGKGIDEPHDMVMMALGWLAREDKIDIQDQGRSREVSLRL